MNQEQNILSIGVINSMKKVDEIKSKSFNDFAEWLNDNGNDDSPWINWFDKTYCKHCDCVSVNGKDYAWCEVYNKCRFFPEMEEVPDCLQMTKMWLNTEE